MGDLDHDDRRRRQLRRRTHSSGPRWTVHRNRQWCGWLVCRPVARARRDGTGHRCPGRHDRSPTPPTGVPVVACRCDRRGRTVDRCHLSSAGPRHPGRGAHRWLRLGDSPMGRTTTQTRQPHHDDSRQQRRTPRTQRLPTAHRSGPGGPLALQPYDRTACTLAAVALPYVRSGSATLSSRGDR